MLRLGSISLSMTTHEDHRAWIAYIIGTAFASLNDLIADGLSFLVWEESVLLGHPSVMMQIVLGSKRLLM